MSYSTKSWLIGILIGSLIATIVVAYVHIAEILKDPTNPILHILQDWIIILVPLLLITYIIIRIIKVTGGTNG